MLYCTRLCVFEMISLTLRAAAAQMKASGWNDTNHADSRGGHKPLAGGFIIDSLKRCLIKTAYDWATDCFIDLPVGWEGQCGEGGGDVD